jgi:hypothetical protein
VLGFAFVIGAFAFTSVRALRDARLAMTDVARTQQQFEPLAQSVRELRDSAAAFDRAVLAYLRSDSEANRNAAVATATRLSVSMNAAADGGSAAMSAPLGPLLERGAAHQGEGFRLLDLQDQRRLAAARLEQTYAALDRRVAGAGGTGIVVGETVISRPSLNELDRAIEFVQ